MKFTGIEIDRQLYKPASGKCADCDLRKLCRIHILSRVCSPILKAGYIWKEVDLMKIPAEALLKIQKEENAILMKQHEADLEEIYLLRKQMAEMSESSERDFERKAKLQARAQLRMNQRFITMENELKNLREANSKLAKELYTARKSLNDASISLFKYKMKEKNESD